LHITPKQTERLFIYLRGSRELDNLLLAALLFGVGLRVGEVAALRISDVSVFDREINIRHPKSNKPHIVAIPRSTLAILRLYLRYRNGKPSDPLLVAKHGGRFASITLARRIQRLGRIVGVNLTSHTGRRYCITRLAGVNLLAAQQQAGHKNMETTLGYVRESRKILHEAMKACDPLGGIR
jgi:integrase